MWTSKHDKLTSIIFPTGTFMHIAGMCILWGLQQVFMCISESSDGTSRVSQADNKGAVEV